MTRQQTESTTEIQTKKQRIFPTYLWQTPWLSKIQGRPALYEVPTTRALPHQMQQTMQSNKGPAKEFRKFIKQIWETIKKKIRILNKGQ